MHERRAAGPAGRGYPGPLDAGLSGTGLVADDLYLLAHDDRSGRPLLPPRPLGTGLAGALLAELMLTRHIGLRSDTAVVTGQDVPRAAVAGHVLLKLIADEPSPLPARAWLEFLSQTAARDVALRLEQAGYLTRVHSRVPGRGGRMVPVNPDWAFAPMLRVRSALDAGREPAPHAAVLTGLAVACGLGFRLEQYQPEAGRSTGDAVAWLPPDLRQLIIQTQITVSSAVLSQRT
jgi:Golgi phosphoprotein 3 GPP34